jgi:hypothetical protein
MVINMDETQLRTIEQIEQFLEGSAEVAFTAHGCDVERYAHISRVLKRFDYPRCNKHDRGVLLRYLQHTSGYSRAQVTRLVKQWYTNRLASIPLAKRYRAPAAPFARKYTALDIELLVEMDKAHEDVCGPAITHLLKRAFHDYGDARFERLAKLSSSHLYKPCAKAQATSVCESASPRPKRCATPSAFARHRAPMEMRALCALIACIRATRTASKGSTTSPA